MNNSREALTLEKIGARIRSKRESLGMTQQELAEMVNVTRNTISRYENGETEVGVITLNNIADLPQVREMAELSKASGLNIDYFPTNFVVQDGLLWYIDYECNKYMEEWSFENWGVKYWSRTLEFEEYLKNH